MKVAPRQDSKSVTDGWLEADKQYTVLLVQTFCQGVLVWSDRQGAAALFPLSEFEIVDSSIPAFWAVGFDLNGYLVLGPASWMEASLWDRYNEDDPVAVRVFEEERARMT